MSDEASNRAGPIPEGMRAVRLHPPGGLERLAIEEIEMPRPVPGEVLVRVHAAGLTRDELEWPVDRLPAIPSYELSGVVASEIPAEMPKVGDPVFGLTPFDRDGVAAEYAVVPAEDLAPAPASLDHEQAAALPLAGLSAWQGLFVHGRLEPDQRVLIHGAAGGVGHLAVQLARCRGAKVIGTATGAGAEAVNAFGADQVVDRDIARFEDVAEPVDLVFDTVGDDVLARSVAVLRAGGRLVSVAGKPPDGVDGTYFVVEPNREQLIQLARLADEGMLRPAIDSVFPLTEAIAAFERLMEPGKVGKVVLRVGL